MKRKKYSELNLTSEQKVARNEATKRYWIKNKDKKSAKQRQYNLQRKYGLSLKDFEEILDGQGGVCKICGGEPLTRHKRKVLFIDHNHDTGEIRGLLCAKCNLGIGHLDTIEKLENAIIYLRGNQVCL